MSDAVIAWVDGSDPRLRAKREKYLGQSARRGLRGGAVDATRWVDNNELQYCVRLIRKNAVWIDRIFVVTDDQIPHWLTPELSVRWNVTIVDHRVIFKRNPECLPTFNSCSIECVLQNIPDLDEEFLYFNDDMFVIRALDRKSCFEDGVVRPRGVFGPSNRLLSKIVIPAIEKLGKKPGLMRYHGGSGYGKSVFTALHLAHAPYPLLKSRMNALFPPERVAEIARYRFRARRQPNPLDQFFNMGVRSGYARLGRTDCAYMDPTEMSVDRMLTELKRIEKEVRFKTLCAQSWDVMDVQVRARLIAFLETQLSS